MPPQLHSRCGGSVLHRRITCTASLQQEDGLTSENSEAAIEGTRAHALFEACILQGIDAMDYEIVEDEDPTVDENGVLSFDMIEHIQDMLDHVRQFNVKFVAEQRVEFDQYVPDPQGAGGTVDLAGYDPEIERLYLWDLKYGFNPVYAENNAQLRIGGLGLHDTWEPLFPVKDIYLSILQPRLDSVTHEILTIEQLRDWAAEKVTPKIIEGLSDEAVFTPGISQCQFCRASGRCKGQRDWIQRQVTDNFNPRALVSTEQIIELYPAMDTLIAWAEKVKELTEKLAFSGSEVPDHKVVNRRTHRKWRNTTTLEDIKRAGVKAPHESTLVTVAQAELQLPRDKRDRLEPLWEKHPGRPKLVPASHPGKPIKLETFKNETN